MRGSVEIEESKQRGAEGGKTDRTSTTIWDELNKWGQSLNDWQRFIASHAVRDGTLSEKQFDEAYRLFLRHSKLDKGDEVLPEIPATVTGRTISTEASPLVLREMRALKNVNAIPEASNLTFGPGLTIIYGHNGAGKSGFVRMLSSACFSRFNPEVLPNIYDDTALDTPAMAEFVLDKGNERSEIVTFKVGDEHADLRRISVFDSSVARIHLTKENELGFQPAGFDVFDELVRVVDLISNKLNSNILARTKPNKFIQLFVDPGPIATQITDLSAKSDVAALRALGTFGQVEQDRLDEVARQEKELLAKSPIETIKALADAKRDIGILQKKIGEIAGQLGEAECNKARGLITTHREAIAVAAKARTETTSDYQLSKIDGDKWDTFIEASRALGLAEKETYPNEGDPCLLCHRPLDEPSVTLIRRMWSYLDKEARKAAVDADKQINAYITQLNAKELNLLPEGSHMRVELSKIKPDLVMTLDAISLAFAGRRDSLVKAVNVAQEGLVPFGDLAVPYEPLAKAIAEIEAQEIALKDGKFDELIRELKTEHITLRQRQVLSKNIDDVLAFVEDLKWLEKASKVKPTSHFITNKQRDLFQTHIEGDYKIRLEEECRSLNCDLLIEFIEFKARGSSGKTIRSLTIKGGYKPDRIFSEGEQRALALADFLTEINLNPDSAAIIFDDPVTSLDHLRKEQIAIRLIKEATIRQVIIFTHDIVFMTKLKEFAEGENKLQMDIHWIECDDAGNPGIVKLNDSPADYKHYLSLHAANDWLSKAKKARGQERVDLIEKGAGALRRGIEEIIIYQLFNRTVVRWDEQVRVNNLREIAWSDCFAKELPALYNQTSRLIDAHSHSDEFGGGTPTLERLEKLIKQVQTVQKMIKDSKNKKGKEAPDDRSK